MTSKLTVTIITLVLFQFLSSGLLGGQLPKQETFSSAALVQEEQTGGMAGGAAARPDTARGMAREILDRSFVYRGSPKKALLLSLLIPGLGQHYVKARKSTWFFGVMEAGLWATMIGHRLSARWAEDNYKGFAADHANVDYRGKELQYFVDVGNFMNIYDYNHKKRIDRREELIYEVTPEYFWEWDSDDNRARFRKMRVDADATRNRATYFGAGIMINHLISAIHAALVAQQGNPIEEANRASRFHVHIDEDPRDGSAFFVTSYTILW